MPLPLPLPMACAPLAPPARAAASAAAAWRSWAMRRSMRNCSFTSASWSRCCSSCECSCSRMSLRGMKLGSGSRPHCDCDGGAADLGPSRGDEALSPAPQLPLPPPGAHARRSERSWCLRSSSARCCAKMDESDVALPSALDALPPHTGRAGGVVGGALAASAPTPGCSIGTEAKIPPLRWRERPPVPPPIKSRTVSGFVVTGPSNPTALIMALMPAELCAGCEAARAGGSGVIGEAGCGACWLFSSVVLSGVAGPSPGVDSEPAADAAPHAAAAPHAGAEDPHADMGMRGAAAGAAAQLAGGAVVLTK